MIRIPENDIIGSVREASHPSCFYEKETYKDAFAHPGLVSQLAVGPDALVVLPSPCSVCTHVFCNKQECVDKCVDKCVGLVSPVFSRETWRKVCGGSLFIYLLEGNHPPISYLEPTSLGLLWPK